MENVILAKRNIELCNSAVETVDVRLTGTTTHGLTNAKRIHRRRRLLCTGTLHAGQYNKTSRNRTTTGLNAHRCCHQRVNPVTSQPVDVVQFEWQVFTSALGFATNSAVIARVHIAAACPDTWTRVARVTHALIGEKHTISNVYRKRILRNMRQHEMFTIVSFAFENRSILKRPIHERPILIDSHIRIIADGGFR